MYNETTIKPFHFSFISVVNNTLHQKPRTALTVFLAVLKEFCCCKHDLSEWSHSVFEAVHSVDTTTHDSVDVS